jgi:hypothetical protein
MLSEDSFFENIQAVVHEVLVLLYERPDGQCPHSLSAVELLLHLFIDLETQLELIRCVLEDWREVYNDVHGNYLEEDS